MAPGTTAKPTVYLETTIPSLLTARPSGAVEIAAQQMATRQWWEQRRQDFEVFQVGRERFDLPMEAVSHQTCVSDPSLSFRWFRSGRLEAFPLAQKALREHPAGGILTL